MKTLNILVKAILMFGLSFTMMACDKKKDSQPNFARNNRRAISPGTPGDPRDPRNAGNVGFIYNFQMNALYDFLGLNGAQAEIGYVSNRQNDSTGIYITGNISQDGRSGRLNIFVHDDIANQTGEAYQVQLDVVNGTVDNRGATITLQDSVGTVTFDGVWNTQVGTWEGDVTYDNGQYLGRFITGECSPVQCPQNTQY